jgi:hypothetical protein
MHVTKAQKKRLQQNEQKRNEQKWSPTLMEAGWTVLPSIILEKQDALGLDAIDVNILLQLARYWWYTDNLPHDKKYKGQQTNLYHFDGLIKAATPYAKEFIAMREQQRNAHAARRSRKKPRPTPVMDSGSEITGTVQ